MSDSWIDKNELDSLVSDFSSGNSNQIYPGNSLEDIFDDIPSMPIPPPRSREGIVSPHLQQDARIQQPVQPGDGTVQDIVSRSTGETPEAAPERFASPFLLDEDDDFDEIESQIEHLASETEKAMQFLQEIRARADRNGLIPPSEAPDDSEMEAESTDEEERYEGAFELVPEPLDRIPLDVEIDPDLSLKGRLQALADILQSHVEMEEMMVVDRDGFSLFSTKASLSVEKCVGEFVKSIRKVYESESDARNHTASQLAVENDKWLCIIPTDGDIDGRFLMKILLPTPLDQPEIYVVVELLNEVLRPETI